MGDRQQRIAWAATAGLVALLLAGCGGSDDAAEATRDASRAPTSPTETPTEQVIYSLDDREEFLATGPSCDELGAWYEQFPADTDGLTALRFIEACHEAPPPVLNRDIYAGGNERLLRALLDPAVTGESRATAHWAIAKGVCRMFTSDQKSLWLVASQVRDYGGTAADYRAVVDEAVAECPSNADDLKLFSTRDVLKTTTEFTQTLRDAGADLATFGADPDDQIAGLAAVACASARDGDSAGNGFFFATLLDVDEGTGTTLAADAVNGYCPQFS